MKIQYNLLRIFIFYLIFVIELFYSIDKLIGAQFVIHDERIKNLKSNSEKCNMELLNTYGVLMDNNKMNQGVKLENLFNTEGFHGCPNLQNSCCSNKQLLNLKKQWNLSQRNILEWYYETYLLTIKYLLGYSLQIQALAIQTQNNPKKQCQHAASQIINLNFNQNRIVNIYEKIKTGQTQLQNLRKGFYCILCYGDLSQSIQEYWKQNNYLFNEKIFYSNDFCVELVKSNISASYFQTFLMQTYLESANTLFHCSDADVPSAYFEVPKYQMDLIIGCYNFGGKQFNQFCEQYCTDFSLTKVTPMIDGNLIEMRKFVELFKRSWSIVFPNPNDNILLDGVAMEENMLQSQYYDEVFQYLTFYWPLTQQVLLDSYKPWFLSQGGLNPFDIVRDNTFILEINTIKRMLVLTLGLTIIFLF